ncbi:MAG TPA: hypothetical protein VMR70_02045 [Flavisolibacter sp.]|nr:hypothetical protein [Flavisolibacter sp.]
MKKICIVTTHHISYNPRVLKEADAFHNRGYQVTVVTVNNHQQQAQFDALLMQTRSWQLKTVNYRKEIAAEKKRWLLFSVTQKMYAMLSRFTFGMGIAERTLLKGYDSLKKLAVNENADIYIAHHAEALPLAYAAAKLNKAKFCFDAEDFHSEMNEGKEPSKDEALISYVETKYLPHCTYITAASKGIGEAYARKYKLPLPQTILNVFPREAVSSPKKSGVVRFYWYSQVIGPNRSLETLVEAAAQIQHPFEVHLRGSFHSASYESTLKALIGQAGLTEKFFFHPPILAEKIIADAAHYDIGLALESDISVNRNICVTNKIFSYLMSGLAIVGTDTYGQKDIFQEFPEAVSLCLQNDANDLARAMSWFLENREKLWLAKEKAKNVAQESFNWERESAKLIAGIERILNTKAPVNLIVAQEQ